MLSVLGPRRAGRAQRRKRPLHTARLARYLPLNHSPSPEREAPPAYALPLPRPAAVLEQAATAATLELAAEAGAAAAVLAGVVPQPGHAAVVLLHSDAAQPAHEAAAARAATAAAGQLPGGAAGAASLPRAAAQPQRAGMDAALAAQAQAPAAPEQLVVPDTPTSSADGGAPLIPNSSLPADASLHRRAVAAAAAAAAAGGTEADSQGRGAHAAGASTPRAAVLAVQAVPDTAGAPASSTCKPLGQACSASSQLQLPMIQAGLAVPGGGTAPVGAGDEQHSRKRSADASTGLRQDNAKRWQRFREEVAGKIGGAVVAADQGAAASAPPPAASPLPVCALSYPQLSGPAGSAPGAIAGGGLAGMGAAAAPVPSLRPQGHSAPATVAALRKTNDVRGEPGCAALSPAGLPGEQGALGACFGASQLPAAGAPLHAIAALGVLGAQPAAMGRSTGRQSSLGGWPVPDQTAAQQRMQQTGEAAALPSRPTGASSAPQRPAARSADRPADAAVGAPAGVIAAPRGGLEADAENSRGLGHAGSPERAAKRQRLDGDGFFVTGAADAGSGGLAAGGPTVAQRCGAAAAGSHAAAWRGDTGAVGGPAVATWGAAAAVGSPTADGRGDAAARGGPAAASLAEGTAMAGSPVPARPGDAAPGRRPAATGQDTAACGPVAAQRSDVAVTGSPAAATGRVAAAAGSPAAASPGDMHARASAAAGSLAGAAAGTEGAIVLSSDSESDTEAAGLRARVLPGLPRGTARITRRCALSAQGKTKACAGLCGMCFSSV